MKIKFVPLLRYAAPFGFRYSAFGAAVYALAVHAHKAAYLIQRFRGARRYCAVCIRPYVQKEIAALAYAFNQLFYKHIRAFIIIIRAAVAPVLVHSGAYLPIYQIARGVEYAARRDYLFRTYKIAVIRRWLPLGKRAEALAAALKAVVKYYVRLERAHHVHKLARTPLFPTHIVIRKIEPHYVYLAVVGAKLAHLSMHIVKVAVKIAAFIRAFRPVAHGMLPVPIMRKVLVVPIYQRIIQPNVQPLSTGGIGKILHYVPPKLCIGGLKTGRCGIKKAKAVVMLRREYYIFHAGAFCCARPAGRIIELRIKFVKIVHIVGFFHLLRTAHPFAARRYGVKPPMDKHAEARIKKPFHAAFVFIAVKAVHLCLLSAFALFLQPYFGLSACSSPLSVFRWQ